MNVLPNSILDRIEVLNTGASSVYGSDAVAGVVNFITKSGFDGLSLEAGYTYIEDTDGDYTGNIAWGTKGDNWDLLVVAATVAVAGAASRSRKIGCE